MFIRITLPRISDEIGSCHKKRTTQLNCNIHKALSRLTHPDVFNVEMERKEHFFPETSEYNEELRKLFG